MSVDTASSLLFALNASSALGLNSFIAVVAFMAVFAFWLRPGGLAWGCIRHRGAAIPGPSGLPVIGLAHVFSGSLTHRVLAALARKMNASPLMAFSVGFTRFIISSDPDTAKEILSASSFADRPVKESAYELLFHRAMGFAPYGDYWRNLRRISATYLFSPRRIAKSGEIRRVIGSDMVAQITRSMVESNEVEVRKVLHVGSLKNVMKTVFGYEFYTSELEELVSEGYDLLGLFNWSDHFGLLRWLDLQRVRSRCRSLARKVNVFVGSIILDHRAKRVGSEEGDFVDVLLDLENSEENKLKESDMIAVLWEMIFRGTDTVAILLEWVIARMVVHPDIQAKARSEILTLVGDRPVTDSDLSRLPYLTAVIKETLRVHPPGPLLSWARLAIHDTHVAGHFIPAGTTAMVNMWSITHDERIWVDPEKFSPERFMGEEDVPVMGSDLRLAPFGSGRRVCPGKAMGLATVQLWLAQLLQSFEWVACDGGVDFSESLKLSLEMKHSLVCRALPRIS